MTFFIITISILVIGALATFFSIFHGLDKDGDFISELREFSFSLGAGLLFVGVIFAVSFGISCLCANSKHFNEDKKIEMMCKKEMLEAELRNCSQDKLPAIYEDIRSYNYNIINGRVWNQRPVTKWTTYDIWEEVELIDLSQFTGNSYSVDITMHDTETENKGK